VVIHRPSIKKGFYGADVSGPVFKRIAQKIFTDTPLIYDLETLEIANSDVEKEFQSYYTTAQTYKTIMPNVVGLPTMDALALLENMGLKVKMQGVGKVKSQSINKGVKVERNQIIILNS
jgi:cell division protein FtsI (penicillin-binding protein 3)